MSAKKKDDVVKPQVIDLEAAAVTDMDETPATPQAEPDYPGPPQQAPAARRNHAAVAIPVLAALAGLVGGGWLYRDVLATYLPSDHLVALEQKIATLQDSETRTASAVQAISGKSAADLSAVRSAISDIKTAADTSTSGLTTHITALDTKIADVAKDVASLKAAPLTTTPGVAPDPALLDALQHRIAALESDVTALQQQAASPAPATRMIAAFAGLQGRIDAGQPYVDELAAMAAAAPGLAVPASVTQAASTGVPAVKSLAEELRTIAASLPAPVANDTPDTGYWSAFKTALKSIVTITPSGKVDWQALARASADSADQGHLREAIAGLTPAGEPPPQLAAWLAKATLRQTLDTDLATYSAAIMQHATAP